MKHLLNPGKYIVAVSGGVDSIVLLDMLAKQTDVDLIVAHFDHGIREQSSQDKDFVQHLADMYHLPFVSTEGRLGINASEQQARQARYDFLFGAMQHHKARAVVTAHHQDDVLETLIMNLLRGTGRKGLTSLKSSEKIVRPLLGYSKQELISYAKQNRLQWHEDESNTDTKYFRNKVRHEIIPRLSESERDQLLKLQTEALHTNKELEELLDYIVGGQGTVLPRSDVISCSHSVAKELVAHWLRKNNVNDFDSRLLEKIVIDAKTMQPGKKVPVKNGMTMEFTKKNIRLIKL